ncbi:ectoine/hydroxyectoine ABC transporter permease subunit EhuD [Bosea psychrotolerans]|uniref:Amino acid ABC transporter membrane protein 2 (PAAT family) n=1 Tax=Bosea psychrotolerans TaxID=1871628 RepID=A0A2S4MQJ8_9HYPH|nr:ectoine/hydroxyectoine ABC transporter permease subunit EhuD [Bosea psychrotolerans]POR56577.1 amino acid ABC transporter membrane protein 2 (PAAT family) [Bosea psychrotolerans]
MMFDFGFALSIIPVIGKALTTTLAVTLLSCIFAALLGFSLEIARRSSKLMRYAMRFVIDFIRSTPVLVQLYFLYYVLPVYGIKLPALVVGVAALSIYYCGYLAEVFKAGIDGIARGQFEAAKSLGLGRFQTVILVIAPQMLRNIAAPMGSYFISIFKSTPYLAVIAVPESFGSALDIASDTFRYGEPLAVVGAIFLAIAVSFSWLIHRFEARLALPGR